MLNLNEICEIINETRVRFNAKLHFHDVCPTPFFTLDEPDEQAEKFITDYFAKKNLTVKFSDDHKQFVYTKNH